MSFILIYTIFPALVLIFGFLDDRSPLAWINPNIEDMANHLWRHVLFAFAFALSFLLSRGNKSIYTKIPKRDFSSDDKIILFSFVFIFISCISIIALSAPVTDYYSHYTKFDHLPPLVRSIVSVIVRLNWGFTSILLVFLFMNYQRYKFLIPFIILIVMMLDLTITSGARIQSFIILSTVLCAYVLFIKQIGVYKLITYSFLVLFAFLFLGILRLSYGEELNLDFANLLLTMFGEFGAVFYSGFILYIDRLSGALPIAPWQMFFYDLWALVPFIDITHWTPINWFHINYHPSAPVPPFTLGPIANSAIWGGGSDLFIRGLLSGITFAMITRLFNAYRDNWIIISIYVFSFSTTILIMKYSIFYHSQLVYKTLFPAVIICWIISKIKFLNLK